MFTVYMSYTSVEVISDSVRGRARRVLRDLGKRDAEQAACDLRALAYVGMVAVRTGISKESARALLTDLTQRFAGTGLVAECPGLPTIEEDEARWAAERAEAERKAKAAERKAKAARKSDEAAERLFDRRKAKIEAQFAAILAARQRDDEEAARYLDERAAQLKLRKLAAPAKVLHLSSVDRAWNNIPRFNAAPLVVYR